MVRTGRDLGVFAGVLALLVGYLVLSVGLSLIRFGVFPPPQSAKETAREESGVSAAAEVLVTVAGVSSIAGGALGIAGSAFASSKPRLSGVIMITAGTLSVLTIIGLISSIAFAAGGVREFEFANAPPGTEPEWQDVETLPY